MESAKAAIESVQQRRRSTLDKRRQSWAQGSMDTQASWLNSIQRELSMECNAVRSEVVSTEASLRELNKFADDDWGTTADAFVRIGGQLDDRKRKLAQSLTIIMNTQDNTPGFMALPPLPESMSEVSSKRVRTAQTSNGRRQFDSGGLTARLDPESVDLAIDEFNLRIRMLDDVKRRMGNGGLASDLRQEELSRREEAEMRLEAMRQRLSYQNRFELYAFEDDELSRVAAFRRWKLACTVVHAIARLREPIRRHARSKANWRKAIKVASATTLFQRMGAKRQDDRIAELLESLPEGSVFDEGYFDEDGKWHYFDEFADEEGSNAGDGYEEVTIKRKKMFPTGAKGAKQDGDGEARGARRNERHPPGWQGEGKDLAVAPRTKRDLERLKAKFEISQRARIRWRRAIAAAKCIVRVKVNAQYGYGPEDDEDANFEFRFEETRTEVVEESTGKKRWVDLSRAELVNTATGAIKVVAVSNFNEAKEKLERLELKGAPTKPGVANLMHTLTKRPDIDPKFATALREAEAQAKAQAEALEFQQKQMELQIQMQQLSAKQEKEQQGGGGYITAEDFKAMEEKKRLAKELAAEQEKIREEEAEKNFSYQDLGNPGLSWDALGAAVIGANPGDDDFLGEPDDSGEMSPFDIAPEDEVRFIIWEFVRGSKFESLIFAAILANCVQLALYDPIADSTASGADAFKPPFSAYKVLEVFFTILFPLESFFKIYAYGMLYFTDFFNKIDFACVLLVFVNLIPGLPNLTVIRTARMLKPFRTISRLPTLKIIVSTLVRSMQDILDVFTICFFVFLVFGVLCHDLFGGSLAQQCINPIYSCSIDVDKIDNCEGAGGTLTLESVERQPNSLTYPIRDRLCGVYDCEEGYECYMGSMNPNYGALNFDHLGFSMMTVFIIITRRGWIEILHLLWDSYGFIAPTVIFVLLQMFGSYLLTQMVTAAITNTYEKVDDEMNLNLQRSLAKAKKQRAARRKYLRSNGVDAPSSDEELEKLYDEYGDEIEKVDKYKEAIEKINVARTKPAKTEGMLSKIGKPLGRLVSFRKKSAPNGDPNDAAQGVPASGLPIIPGNAAASSVLPGPPVGQQVPISGQQQVPMMGQQQVPMTGQQQMPMMGQQQVPMTGQQQVPMMGQQQMPVISQQQQASFMGQQQMPNAAPMSTQPQAGPTATIGGAPADSITDNAVQMGAQMGNPMMMGASMGAPMGAPMGDPMIMGAPMGAPTGDPMMMGAPMGAPMGAQMADPMMMGAPMGAPGGGGIISSLQGQMPGAVAPNAQTIRVDPARDRMMQARMWEHQAMMGLGAPKKPRLIQAIQTKYFSKRPKWANWRGIPILRRVTRRPEFGYIVYVGIFVNMYTMTISDVRTLPCMYTYDASEQDDALGQATLAQYSSTAPAEVVIDGDCIRGAAISLDDPYYLLMEQVNTVCTLVFAGELFSQFLAEGFRYFDKIFNVFDGLIVLITLIDLIQAMPGISAARLFRLTNLLNKSARFKSLKMIVTSIANSLGPLNSVVALAVLFLFIFAVGGLQLYGLNLPGHDRINYKDFPGAFLTTFVLFTGDGWSGIMFKFIAEEGYWNLPFFLIFMIYGLFGISLLILATLISKFDCGSLEDFSMDNVIPLKELIADMNKIITALMKGSEKKRLKRERKLADLRARGLAPPEVVVEEVKEEEKKSDEKKTGSSKRLTKAEKEEEKKLLEAENAVVVVSAAQKEADAAKEHYFIMASTTIIKEHPAITLNRCALETQEQIALDNAPIPLSGPIGYGALKIEPDGALREMLSKVVDRPWFENFILFCIMASCLMMAVEGAGLPEDSPLVEPFLYAEYSFLGVFVLECILRMLHKGVLFTNVAYLRDPWNQLDFFIVLTNIISTAFSSLGGSVGRLRALRGFRALRPLKALKQAPELRAVVDVIAKCLPVFINIAICTLAFYAVGGVLSMTFFGGRFWRCNDPSIRYAEDCGGFFALDSLGARFDSFDDDAAYKWPQARIQYTKQWPVSYNMNGTDMVQRQWYNAPRNFDSTPAAMLTIFELGTLDHWVEVLFQAMDSPEFPGQQTLSKGEEGWGYAFFIVFLVVIANYLLMNLLVCGVVVVYDRLKIDSKSNPDLSRGQRELIDAVNLMIRTRPGFRQVKPDEDESNIIQRTAWKIVSFDLDGKERGTTFELIISILVVLNTLFMCMDYTALPAEGEWIKVSDIEAMENLQDTPWRRNLDMVNDCFFALFLVELVLKIVAYGIRNWWRDAWNKFDALIIGSGLVQTILMGFMGIQFLPPVYSDGAGQVLLFDPKTLRILRVFRLVRIVRLLRGLAKYERVQAITQLLDTLQNCLKHIVNVFGLWMIITATFALIGMNLFGTLPYGKGEAFKYGVYGDYTNFSTFIQSMNTLFKVATLDNWTWLMRDIMAGQRNNGSYPFAWIYFVFYLILTAFLFLNIFTAIVMDQYGFTARVTTKPGNNGLQLQIMTFNQASTISEEWSYMDPEKTGFVDAYRVRNLLKNIGPPVGFAPDTEKSRQLRHLRRMELRMTGRSQQIHYVDFYLSCALLRYRMLRKPLADLDLNKIRGKLSLEILLAFPSISDPRLEDSAGLLSANQAVNFLQSQYRGLILRRLMAKGDIDAIMDYDDNRLLQQQRREERRALEEEEARRAAQKSQGGATDKKGKGKGKKKKKK